MQCQYQICNANMQQDRGYNNNTICYLILIKDVSMHSIITSVFGSCTSLHLSKANRCAMPVAT